MENIVPLYYEMKKAKPAQITSEVFYNGMIANYTGGNIGIYSNHISKIFNNGEEIDKKELNIVKWLCMENNYVIKVSHLMQ